MQATDLALTCFGAGLLWPALSARPAVFMFLYRCAYTHTHIHIHTHTRIHTHTHIHTYIHTYIHTLPANHAPIHLDCVAVHQILDKPFTQRLITPMTVSLFCSTCTHTHTHTHTYTHIHTHAHTHTPIRAPIHLDCVAVHQIVDKPFTQHFITPMAVSPLLHIHTHTHTHTYIHTYMHTRTHTHPHTHLCQSDLFICEFRSQSHNLCHGCRGLPQRGECGYCSYTLTPIHTCTHAPIHPYTLTLTPIHPYTHTHMHRYTHTPIHTYTHTPLHHYTHTPLQPYTHKPIHTHRTEHRSTA